MQRSTHVQWVVIHFLSGHKINSYGKSPFSMGKSTISMAIFNSYVSHYQRLTQPIFPLRFHLPFAIQDAHPAGTMRSGPPRFGEESHGGRGVVTSSPSENHGEINVKSWEHLVNIWENLEPNHGEIPDQRKFIWEHRNAGFYAVVCLQEGNPCQKRY